MTLAESDGRYHLRIDGSLVFQAAAFGSEWMLTDPTGQMSIKLLPFFGGDRGYYLLDLHNHSCGCVCVESDGSADTLTARRPDGTVEFTLRASNQTDGYIVDSMGNMVALTSHRMDEDTAEILITPTGMQAPRNQVFCLLLLCEFEWKLKQSGGA